MKKAVYTILLLAAIGCQQKETPKATKTMEDSMIVEKTAARDKPSIYDFELRTLQGEDIVLANYKGRKMLIVNTASECGYTPQYKELQELYDKHGDKLVVLGFPANNFGGQEPGSNEEIATFCERNYGVTFPIFEKISVAGDDMHPLFQYLSSKELNGVTDEKPNWNFCKYLIDEEGNVMQFFNSKVTPMSNEMLTAIHQ